MQHNPLRVSQAARGAQAARRAARGGEACRDAGGDAQGRPSPAPQARLRYFLSIATKPPPEWRSTESESLAISVRFSILRAAGSAASRSSVA